MPIQTKFIETTFTETTATEPPEPFDFIASGLFGDREMEQHARGSAKDRLYGWLKRRAEEAELAFEKEYQRCKGLEERISELRERIRKLEGGNSTKEA